MQLLQGQTLAQEILVNSAESDSARFQPHSAPTAHSSRPPSLFELLDDAFANLLDSYPQEILELRRQRIRSGT
jgi:hypothetical protein